MVQYATVLESLQEDSFFFPIPVVQYVTVLESLQEGSFFVNRTEFDFGTTHPNDFQWFKKMCFNTLFDN